jgi:transposase
VEVEELNVLKPNKQTTIQTLLALGKGQREIARATGIDRKTIRRYAGQGVPANSPGVATGSPEQIPPPRPPAHTSACEPWREFIAAQLELKRNAMAIYQDLVDVHGFGHGYNSVKRFVARLCAREPEQFDRLEFARAKRRRSTTAKARSPGMR